jgi:hypothetical protein
MLSRGSHPTGRRTLLPLTLLVVGLLGAATMGCASSSSDSSAAGQSATNAPVQTIQLFDTNFQPVCQGATVSRATAYDPKAPTHKVLYFESYRDTIVATTSKIPTDWQVQFDANSDALAAVDLVACAVRTQDTFVKDCTGYKDNNGVDSGNVAKLHSATYELTVHEAKTGKSLGSTTIDAPASDCPTFLTFDGDTTTLDYYEPPSQDAVVAFVKPFAQPDNPTG